jgi:hypothetical protein
MCRWCGVVWYTILNSFNSQDFNNYPFLTYLYITYVIWTEIIILIVMEWWVPKEYYIWIWKQQEWEVDQEIDGKMQWGRIEE